MIRKNQAIKRKRKNAYFLGRILNIVVPQVGHIPFIAFLSVPPLPFILTSLPSFISFFALHLTQYASILTPQIFSLERPSRAPYLKLRGGGL